MPDRDYRKEYDDYYGIIGNLTPDQSRHRAEKASRNKARSLVKEHRTVPSNKDVHHKDGNPLNNKIGNLAVVTRRYNRGLK